MLDAVFEKLRREQLVRIKIEAVSMDPAIVKVHPDGTGALKKRSAGDRQIPRRMEHQDSSGCRKCSNGDNALSPVQAHDAQQGRELLGGLGPLPEPLPLLMDRAWESIRHAGVRSF